jgi:replicative DNA helicase
MSQPKTHPADALPDHALDAEAAVLGACIHEPAMLDAIGWLRTEDFFSTPHRLVFAAVRRLREAGTPADAVTLGSHLRDRGELVEVGGLVRLGDLLFACPVVEDVAHYARIVRQAAQVRALERVAFAVSVRCRAPVADRPALLAEARAAIEAATELGAVETPGVAVGALVATVLTAAASPEPATGRTLTGFSALDRATTGLSPRRPVGARRQARLRQDGPRLQPRPERRLRGAGRAVLLARDAAGADRRAPGLQRGPR